MKTFPATPSISICITAANRRWKTRRRGIETNFPPVTEETPQFRDIHIENVICRGAQNAIVLQGLPEMPLRDITLKNVSITSQQGVSVTDAENITFENVRVETRRATC